MTHRSPHVSSQPSSHLSSPFSLHNPQAPTPRAAEVDVASPDALPMLPWVFAGLGIVAPLALVAAAATGSRESAVRAQMIVQGCELLSFALLATAVVALLHAMALNAAGRTQPLARNRLQDSPVA